MVQLVRVESAEDFNQNGTEYYRLLNCYINCQLTSRHHIP